MKALRNIDGRIECVNVNKSGYIDSRGKADVTKDAINTVFALFVDGEAFASEGFFGYRANVRDTDVQFCVFDMTRYKLVQIEDEKQ